MTFGSEPPQNWHVLSPDDAALEALSADLHLPRVIAHLLVCRGIRTTDRAREFLHPDISQLNDPFTMLGMRTAVSRLREALLAGEPILIYGDYDVDGTVATVLLKTALERAAAALGGTADIRYHIPHRLREGYGLQALPLREAAAAGVKLAVSVDTGIRAYAAAEEARQLGLDLIITDHHLPEQGRPMPEAVAVLNPNQPGCTYPCKELCGAAVAFKVAQALLNDVTTDAAARERLNSRTLPSFLKLLAIATIADSVPLQGENRVIASLGLAALQQPVQSGLRALMEFAGVDCEQPVSTFDVGFRLAPRLNAAGRLEVASDVVELFISRDAVRSRELAEKLHRLNEERRATEAEALLHIEALLEELERSSETGLPACVVLDDSQAPDAAWHRGVIGILASRVVERTGRPALVLAHAEGEAHGSGRSVPGFHLLDVLTAAHHLEPTEKLFNRFGGHAQAAGFALRSELVPQLRARMAALAGGLLQPDADAPPLTCHAELRLHEIEPEFLSWLERLAPFGMGAPEPVFMTRGVRLREAPRVIKDRHLRLSVADPTTGATKGGMAWGRRINWRALADRWSLAAGSPVDLAYRLCLNRHPEFGGWEMDIVAIRPSA